MNYLLVSMFVLFHLLMYIAGTKIKQIGVDLGKNVSLPCALKTDKKSTNSNSNSNNNNNNNGVLWYFEEDSEIDQFDILPNGSLAIVGARLNDSGIYTCILQGSGDKYSVKLLVRTTPPALANVRIHPSTILALILWEVKGTGGYPIIHFTAQYKLAYSNETWKPISPNHISPNCRQIDVYKLEPNTTYAFRVWARNHLGIGVITEVEGTTRYIDQDKELARIFLAGFANFDQRIWMVAVSVVMGTFLVLSLGICAMMYHECRTAEQPLDDDVIELVPNIIVNPGFVGNQNENSFTKDSATSEDCRQIMNQLLNNNTQTTKY